MFSLIFSIPFRAMKLRVVQVSRIFTLQMSPKLETYSPAGPLREFCDWIETDPATGKLSSAEGWAKKKGSKWVVDRWATWPSFATVVSSITLIQPVYATGISHKPSPRSIITRLPTAKVFMAIVRSELLNADSTIHFQTRRRSLGPGSTAVNGVNIPILNIPTTNYN